MNDREFRRPYEWQADAPEPCKYTVDVSVPPLRQTYDRSYGGMFIEPIPECDEIVITVIGRVGAPEPGSDYPDARIVSARYADGAKVHPDAFENWRDEIESELIAAWYEEHGNE